MERAEAKLYEQVAGGIARQIREGVLRAGERIPSVRRTSRQQRVSVSTVLQAYFLLENQGLIEARPQSGFYVKPRPAAPPPEPTISAPPASAVRLSSGDLIAEVLASTRDPQVVPLGAAVVSPDLMPAKTLARLTAALARESCAKALGYEFPPGLPALRRQIAKRGLELGWAFKPDEVLVTNGCMEALNLCLRAVAKAGDTVAVESPCYYGILELMESLGLKALELPTHPREGLSLSALTAALRRHKVKALITIPSFLNPLGSCMPEENRRELARLAAKRRLPLIEDDIYGDLYFEANRPKPIAAFDREGWVLFCSSFSKTLASGFRVGWTLPGRFRAEVEKLKRNTTLANATLPQMAVAEYLQSGGYERHLRQLRRALQDNVRRVSEAVARHFPKGTRVSRPEGGYVLWVEFPKGTDALALYRRALAEQISIAPGPIFSAKQKYRNCVRLNCGHPWSDRMDAALRRLGEWLTEDSLK